MIITFNKILLVRDSVPVKENLLSSRQRRANAVNLARVASARWQLALPNTDYPGVDAQHRRREKHRPNDPSAPAAQPVFFGRT
jgi:hypothetical protein